MGLPHYAVPDPQPDNKRTSSSIPEADVHLNVVEDRTIGNERALRGVPVAGIGGGAITGTRPGDSAAALDRDAQHLNDAARRITRERMRAARKRLGRMEPPDPVR